MSADDSSFKSEGIKLELIFASPRRQAFALPPDVISHIFNKPLSPEGLQKIFQTCKYFFAKRQIVVFNQSAIFNKNELLSRETNMKKIFNVNKKISFWFTNKLRLFGSSSLNNIVYRTSLISLTFIDSILTLADFEILAPKGSKIQNFELINSSIYYLDGTYVSIDVIFQNLPMAEKISFDNKQEKFSKKTLENLNKVKFLNPFQNFILTLNMSLLSNSFEPSLVCQFLNKNLIPKYFSNGIIYIYGENGQNISDAINNSNIGIFKSSGKKTFNTHVMGA